MATKNVRVTSQAIRLKAYRHFSEMPHSMVAQLMKLGLRGGKIRGWALKFDPPTIVATAGSIDAAWTDCEAVGWLVLVRPDENARPYMAVFVHPDWRRQGIGTRLVRHMNSTLTMWNKPLRVDVKDRIAKAFFDAAGFQNG
jgi:GNAT superfamily N-acetyltransferase